MCSRYPGREIKDNSCLQFNGFIQQDQLHLSYTITKRRRNSSGSGLQPPEPEPHSSLYYSHSILSIRMTLHYIITSPCFHHSSENIPYNISHNPHGVLLLQTRLVSSRAQERLNLRQSCFPSLARIMRHGRANQRAMAFPVPGEYADERTDQRPDSSAHVKCLTSSAASMPDTITTSNITLGYKA